MVERVGVGVTDVTGLGFLLWKRKPFGGKRRVSTLQSYGKMTY